MSEIIPLTASGYQKLENELNDLKSNVRPQVIAAIAAARAHGDLKENAEYHAAKEKQAFVEGRISLLEDQLARSKVINLDGEKIDRVKFGTFVTLEEGESGTTKTYQLVGDLEADINANKISINSPIGKAVLGKSVDDEVDVVVPKGRVLYTIAAITA
ncbi:MAG: transcription elongation factor GreA [Pseudomonadota bacterium]|nr:transcription elongation factor GreA [Pseudomonadota bacterium]